MTDENTSTEAETSKPKRVRGPRKTFAEKMEALKAEAGKEIAKAEAGVSAAQAHLEFAEQRLAEFKAAQAH